MDKSKLSPDILNTSRLPQSKLNLDLKHQEINTSKLNLDSKHQEITASRLPLDTKYQELTASRLPLDTKYQELTASRLPLDTKYQELNASRLPASLAIWNKNNVWINDNMVMNCHHCKKYFSLFVRKHHCRNCGNVFCYDCTNKYIVIPGYISEKPNAADYWNISHYVSSLKNEKEKVCDECYQLINEKVRSREKMIGIFNNPMPITQVYELSSIDNDIKNDYFDTLRNIQYYLPNHVYSITDCKLLEVNAQCFSKHCKYVMHLIKSIPWKRIKNTKVYEQKKELIVNILNSEKKIQCKNLFCTRTCQDYLSCDDCINILYSNAHDLPPDILKYLFIIVSDTSSDIILSNLLFFIKLIKDYENNKLLQTLLFNLVISSQKAIYKTFWLLKNELEFANAQQKINIESFLLLFDTELIEQMNSQYDFFAGLIKNINNPQDYLINNFENHKPINLPYDPTVLIYDVDIENIVVKSSFTKPIIITFQTTVGPKRILFKNESIMNDVTVLNLMSLCDIILQDSLDPNFHAIIYPVMPLTRNSGMIELVENSMTIHDITNTKKTILQHIIEKNENKVIGNVLTQYMFSLVSYTLHSYFIGLGDRHLQNIMITDDGSIFHIDFGFILGKDAHPITCGDIKLNTGMLDVIGGQGSVKYNAYLELCAQGVVILRKYFNIFFILLSQIQNTTFNEIIIEKFIMSRFQPRQSDNTVVSEIMAVIKHSNDTYADYIRDFIHFHSQESTVKNGLSKMVYDALGFIKTAGSWG